MAQGPPGAFSGVEKLPHDSLAKPATARRSPPLSGVARVSGDKSIALAGKYPGREVGPGAAERGGP